MSLASRRPAATVLALAAPAAGVFPAPVASQQHSPCELHDPYAARQLTVRDLLSHRSGLSRGELAWDGPGFDRGEIVRRVRFVEHLHLDSFRARFDTPVLPPVPVTFRIAGSGRVESVVLEMAGTAEFRRVQAPRTP